MSGKDSDPIAGVYHLAHDWDDTERLGYLIIRAVSAITGVKPMSLPPLDGELDTDALSSLFCGPSPAGHSTDYIALTYANCRITVHRNGHVILHPPTQD